MAPATAGTALTNTAGTGSTSRRSWRPPTVAIAATLVLGAVALLAAAVAWAGNRSETTAFGLIPATPPAGPSRPAAADGRPVIGHASPPTTTPPAHEPMSASGESTMSAPSDAMTSPASEPAGVPVALGIPDLGVTAAVDPVVADSSGVLGVPTDVTRVGWWSVGVEPGAPVGSVVIDGHVDAVDQGPGAFFRLDQLEPGDPVQVTTDEGAVIAYSVTARRTYSKSSPLPTELFDRQGPPQLVLITCGGDFDRRALSYESNIVIFAEPSPA